MKSRMDMGSLMTVLGVFVVSWATGAQAGPVDFDDCYRVETIALPKDVPPEVGALGFTPEGELVVALRRSDILMAKPTKDASAFRWRVFARGMHNICGMHVISKDEIIVSQMPELTRVTDTDGDGEADRYETLSSGWGMSGNYHETNAMVPDGKGGYFIAVGTASHNGPVFYNVRGEYSKIGRRGRNFSAAEWRGWVLHVDAKGKLTPYASGFRMHNGIMMDGEGNLWCGDNQGDWKATTPLYHVRPGHFYGHMASLVWDEEWRKSGRDPLLMEGEEYERRRTKAAVLLPHELMNRSASEPVQIPEGGKFGPYGGQMLLPDNNGTRISRVMLEKVGGEYQGACTHFVNGHGLQRGNNRVVFNPEKNALYVGQTSRGWGVLSEGLQRITWLGKTPFDVRTMSLTKEGFRLKFTRPVDVGTAGEARTYKMTAYRYEDSAEYGGPQKDVHVVPITGVSVEGEDDVMLMIDSLEPGWVYQLDVKGLKDRSGSELFNEHFCYTANRLR